MNNRERLRAWIRAHTDQRSFASDIGIHETYLSQTLSGRRTPRLPILYRIEQQTGVPVSGWVPLLIGDAEKRRKARRKLRSLGKGKSHAAVG
jgi:transcriptional regulator with XRE-family HTH domain